MYRWQDASLAQADVWVVICMLPYTRRVSGNRRKAETAEYGSSLATDWSQKQLTCI